MDLQVYKADGTILADAILKKYTWNKSYGAFDSKIAGQLLYIGKGLDATMLLGCYVVYDVDGQKYTIINAPSSESFLYVRDNNGLNGNNRYSCEFFAPEYFLTQYEFLDLPINTSEESYRGGQTSFYLCCSIDELIERIQKSLDRVNGNTPAEKWVIERQGTNTGTFPIDPMQFDKNSIADVLQQIEEVYGLHYFVNYKPDDPVACKRIYVGNIVTTMTSGHVFDFGQDKGLTSSIRVSKKESMTSKLYPKGSTNNVPFRYPVIRGDDGNIIEHSYYSERLLPQFAVDIIKNNVKNTTTVWRDTFTTYPTVLDYPYFWVELDMGGSFSWDDFDMRNVVIQIYTLAGGGVSVGNFSYYDMNGDYAFSFDDGGTWKNNKSTRNYNKFPKGYRDNIRITLEKNIVFSGGAYFPYPRTNNYPLKNDYAIWTTEWGGTSQLLKDAFQGVTTIPVIKQDYIDYILANNSPLLPYPGAGATTGFKNPYNSQTPFVEHVDYEDIHPTIKEATYQGKRIDMLRADSYGWNENVKMTWNDNWLSPGVPEDPYFSVVINRASGGANNTIDDAWRAGDFLTTPFVIHEDGTTNHSVFMFLNENDYRESFYVNGLWTADSPNRDFDKYPKWLHGGNDKREITFIKKVWESGGTWNIYPNSSSYFYTKTHSNYGKFIYFPETGVNSVLLFESPSPPFLGWGEPSADWDDTINPDTLELNQSVFRFPLNKLGFDLFACAIENEEMFIHMTSGSCQGSRFRIAVRNWQDWVRNFYERDDNGRWVFIGRQSFTNSMEYPDTTDNEVDLIVYKDIETWGQNFVQPTSLRYPKAIPAPADTFVITGITLPELYFTNAQTKLQNTALEELKDKNAEKFDYQFNISNIHLENEPAYKKYIDTNIKISFRYNDSPYQSFFQTISIQYGGVLPVLDTKISDILTKRRTVMIIGGDTGGGVIFIGGGNTGGGASRTPGIGTSERERSMTQQDTTRLGNSISNSILQQIRKFDFLDGRIDDANTEIAQLSERIETGSLLFEKPPVILDTINDVISLFFKISVIDGKMVYMLDMAEHDGVEINALTFYDGGIPATSYEYNIQLNNMQVGKRYFIKVNYGSDLLSCPPTTYYQLTFIVNERHFIIDLNGDESNPIINIIFINNGIFTETIVINGKRISSCEINNDVRSVQDTQV